MNNKDDKMLENEKNTAKTKKAAGIEVIHHNGSLDSYTLSNGKGMSATVINYGATIAKIEVPDRDGIIADVVLGHEDLNGFIDGRYYLGATVGRYANRIAAGHFRIHGKECQVTKNKNGNMLHGGEVGFDKKFWKAEVLKGEDGPAVEMSLISPDGEEGFPGTLNVKIIYTLTSGSELRIEYAATTDKSTVINLTNHSYFNLTGSAANTILDHVLMINADAFTPTDDQSIPTGEIRSVAGTPLDFRKLTPVGDRIGEQYEQITNAKGYDKNFVLNNYDGNVREAATVYEPKSGRLMEVLTDQPGVQFYSGNYLDGTMKGKGGLLYRERTALCLECQHFPDSPNEENFPATVLEPGQVYRQTTVYRFSADRDR